LKSLINLYFLKLAGSYKCACTQGYVAVDNGHSCKANLTEYSGGTKLLLTNRYYLKLTDLDGKTDTLVKDQINAVALDFDWASNCSKFIVEQKLYFNQNNIEFDYNS
jgi:hypothetical protein